MAQKSEIEWTDATWNPIPPSTARHLSLFGYRSELAKQPEAKDQRFDGCLNSRCDASLRWRRGCRVELRRHPGYPSWGPDRANDHNNKRRRGSSKIGPDSDQEIMTFRPKLIPSAFWEPTARPSARRPTISTKCASNGLPSSCCIDQRSWREKWREGAI